MMKIIQFAGLPLTIILTVIPYYYFVNLVPLGTSVFGFPHHIVAFIVSSVVLSACLLFFEHLCPLEQFSTNPVQRRTDIFNNMVTGVVFVVLHPYVLRAPSFSAGFGFSLGVSAWPWPWQFLIGLFFQDLLLYWWHRALHESGNAFLWKIHLPHHTPQRLSFLAGGRGHVLDISALLVALFLTQMVFELTQNVMMWVFLWPVLSGAIHHTNVDFRFGFFNWIFPGPEMHRAHHDVSKEQALNYATSLPLLDIVFGTAKPLRKGGMTTYGVAEHNDESETYMQAFLRPFF